MVMVRWCKAALIAVGLVLSVAASHADDAIDPPGRVGRLSYIAGGVDVFTETVGDWQPASLNVPVTSRTALWTPDEGRVEVRVGSTSLRLAGNTQANFTQLDDDGLNLDIAQGTVRVRLRSLAANERVRFTAGGVVAEALSVGDYRIDYDPTAQRLTAEVFHGRLTLNSNNDNQVLERGQLATFDVASGTLQSVADISRTPFDQWVEQRDHDQDHLVSVRYVSQEMTGVEDLDANGRWANDPQYGAVWYPTQVVVGWAPYRYGHWAWVAPWGWTWVDDSRWGFAPFHYGRWAFVNGAWGWCPGERVVRPVYAPALVSFVGNVGGVHVSLSIGGGAAVGWFPLAPHEVYRPTYHTSENYVRQVNITHVTNITNITNVTNVTNNTTVNAPAPSYRYAHMPNAVTVVPHDAFAGARPVGHAQLQVAPEQLAHLQPVVSAQAPVAPPRVLPPVATNRPFAPQRRFEQGAAASNPLNPRLTRPVERVGEAPGPQGRAQAQAMPANGQGVQAVRQMPGATQSMPTDRRGAVTPQPAQAPMQAPVATPNGQKAGGPVRPNPAAGTQPLAQPQPAVQPQPITPVAHPVDRVGETPSHPSAPNAQNGNWTPPRHAGTTEAARENPNLAPRAQAGERIESPRNTQIAPAPANTPAPRVSEAPNRPQPSPQQTQAPAAIVVPSHHEQAPVRNEVAAPTPRAVPAERTAESPNRGHTAQTQDIKPAPAEPHHEAPAHRAEPVVTRPEAHPAPPPHEAAKKDKEQEAKDKAHEAR